MAGGCDFKFGDQKRDVIGSWSCSDSALSRAFQVQASGWCTRRCRGCTVRTPPPNRGPGPLTAPVEGPSQLRRRGVKNPCRFQCPRSRGPAERTRPRPPCRAGAAPKGSDGAAPDWAPSRSPRLPTRIGGPRLRAARSAPRHRACTATHSEGQIGDDPVRAHVLRRAETCTQRRLMITALRLCQI